MKNGFLTDDEKKRLQQTSILQHRRAFEIAKTLRAISPNKVTYLVSQEITVEGPDLTMKMKTRIHELPELRIYHEKNDMNEELLLDVDIDGMVSAE